MSEQLFPDEQLHLAETLERLGRALADAEANVELVDQNYRDIKRYMVDNRGEIDPHEMFQNELALNRIDNMGVIAAGSRERLAKLADSPYFARIDFQAEDDEEEMPYYIGRFSFNDKGRMLIFDWRAPIANMFYDSEIGPAGYQAPMGRIDGELTRKRQFKVLNGQMEYVLESAVNIQDEVLQRELSQTSDNKMKSIIATIQKEQNEIIRNEQTKVMIIQGVAGSGKTSIALHRIAFLLYRQRERLTAKNIMILSPNRVFGDYIANVLPELGEEPVYEWSFAEIAGVQLEGVIGFAADRDPFEVMDQSWADRVQRKSTLAFFQQLERYAADIPEWVLDPRDCCLGNFSVSGEWIKKRYMAYGSSPVRERLRQVAQDICDRWETENIMEDELPGERSILKYLQSMLKVRDTLSLYRQFYQELGQPEMLVMADKNTLEWADVYPFLYLHSFFAGVQVGRVIRHLVIDEMQDYTPVQYAAINRIFPCDKTILGDFGQAVNPNHIHCLKDLDYLFPGSKLVYLDKSYRSSYEIIAFARRIKCEERLQAAPRHGKEPQLVHCADREMELEVLRERIREFVSGGYTSMGIVAKTNQAAACLYHDLQQGEQIHLIAPDSAGYVPGISVVSVSMSKGLEFDKVILVDADQSNYRTKEDRNLLYVAVTRAMHELEVFYTDELSRLIGERN